MSKNDLLYAIEHINEAEAIKVTTFANSNKTEILLSVPVKKGDVILVEIDSKSRGSILFKNAWEIEKRVIRFPEGVKTPTNCVTITLFLIILYHLQKKKQPLHLAKTQDSLLM